MAAAVAVTSSVATGPDGGRTGVKKSRASMFFSVNPQVPRAAISREEADALSDILLEEEISDPIPLLFGCDICDDEVIVTRGKGYVTQEELQRLYILFDKNYNGYFELEDVMRLLKKYHASSDTAMELFDEMDPEGTGKVTYEMFETYLDGLCKKVCTLGVAERIFLTFSESGSSILGRYCAIVVMFVIIFSTACFVMESDTDFMERPDLCSKLEQGCPIDGVPSFPPMVLPEVGFPNATAEDAFKDAYAEQAEFNCCEPEAVHIFFYFELVSIIIFTLEYLARFFTAYSCTYDENLQIAVNLITRTRVAIDDTTVLWKTVGYALQMMNLIDFFAIAPFYLELAMGAGGGLGFLRVMRLARVFRVFKMGKYNNGMELLGRTFTQSLPALQLLVFFGLIGIVLFASMIYFVELGAWELTEDFPNGAYYRWDSTGYSKETTGFNTIPRCFWWVTVTATTVGYGDLFPTSPLGKCIGAITMIVGLVVLALPITILGSNFANEYQKIQEEEAREKYELEAAEAVRESLLAARGLQLAPTKAETEAAKKSLAALNGHQEEEHKDIGEAVLGLAKGLVIQGIHEPLTQLFTTSEDVKRKKRRMTMAIPKPVDIQASQDVTAAAAAAAADSAPTAAQNAAQAKSEKAQKEQVAASLRWTAILAAYNDFNDMMMENLEETRITQLNYDVIRAEAQRCLEAGRDPKCKATSFVGSLFLVQNLLDQMTYDEDVVLDPTRSRDLTAKFVKFISCIMD